MVTFLNNIAYCFPISHATERATYIFFQPSAFVGVQYTYMVAYTFERVDIYHSTAQSFACVGERI